MTIWIANAVLGDMITEASEIFPLETGGILLGWRSGADRVVNAYRGPGHRALHGRYNFFPDHRWQLAEIRAAFKESGGDLDYLGDWHTHPDGVALMSDLDHSTLRGIARRVPDPLMIILAGGPGTQAWGYSCWTGRRHRAMLREKFVAIDEQVKTFVPPAGVSGGSWK